jgi:xylan 1,4-beta-xylosidase
MYSSYTAASFPRKLEIAAKHGVNLEGALTWAFEFENQPPFAGFRQVASAGLDLPVLNVFRMFGKMSGQQIAATSSAGFNAEIIRARNVREQPDVSAMASLDGRKLFALAWHYHDDDVPGPDATISLALNGLPLRNGEATLTQYRVDANHSNSYEAWKRLGSPDPIPPELYAQLEKAGKLAQVGAAGKIQIKDGKADINFNLPRQGVALFAVEWP